MAWRGVPHEGTPRNFWIESLLNTPESLALFLLRRVAGLLIQKHLKVVA